MPLTDAALSPPGGSVPSPGSRQFGGDSTLPDRSGDPVPERLRFAPHVWGRAHGYRPLTRREGPASTQGPPGSGAPAGYTPAVTPSARTDAWAFRCHGVPMVGSR